MFQMSSEFFNGSKKKKKKRNSMNNPSKCSRCRDENDEKLGRRNKLKDWIASIPQMFWVKIVAVRTAVTFKVKFAHIPHI